MTLSLGLVFLAGLVSFLSPCVLSMVPVYLGILGAAGTTEGQTRKTHFDLLLTGTFFILGFTVIFITLGFSATVFGNFFYFLKPWIARIGGILIVLYGLHLSGIITLPFLDYEWKPIQKINFQNRYMNAFLMGIVFSAGWSPCIGPILGTILTALAASEVTVSQGLLYLLLYSLGIGLPFLVAAEGFQPLVQKIKQNHILVRRIQQASGILLVIIGVLLTLGWLTRLAQIAPKWLL